MDFVCAGIFLSGGIYLTMKTAEIHTVFQPSIFDTFRAFMYYALVEEAIRIALRTEYANVVNIVVWSCLFGTAHVFDTLNKGVFCAILRFAHTFALGWLLYPMSLFQGWIVHTVLNICIYAFCYVYTSIYPKKKSELDIQIEAMLNDTDPNSELNKMIAAEFQRKRATADA
jgi:hypothetical protein